MRPVFRYLRAVSCASLLFGFAGLVMAVHYWLSIAVLYVAFILLAVDSFVEPWPKRWMRWLGASMISLIAIVFSFFFVLVSAPLDIHIYANSGDYPDGSKIGNISWKPYYTDLRFAITNSSSKDYENVAIELNTDMWVAEGSQITNLPGISIHARSHVLDPQMRSRGKDHKLIPFATSGVVYDIYCDKIPRKTTIEVAIAVVNFMSPSSQDTKLSLEVLPPEKIKSLIGPKKMPQWVSAKAKYRVGLRPFSAFKRQEKFS